MAKKLKLKKKNGAVVDFPLSLVKSVLKKAGFAGGQLALATTGVVKEVAKLAGQGIVSTADLEKAIIKAVANTNAIVMDRAKKVTKKAFA